MSYSRAELMAVVISRAMRDGDVVLTGTNAAIPTAGYRVAQRLGVDGLVAINGAHGTVDPTVASVPPSSADEELRHGRFNISLADVVSAETRRLFDVVFLGALQIDRRARMNLVCVGDYEHPTLRGPGTLGLSMVAVVDRTIVYVTRHDERTFVDEVDFVSSEGMRADGGGVELIVTPLAVLGPTPSRDRIDVVSIHAGVPHEELVARTGFPLNMGSAIETPEPTDAELDALRAVDTAGHLRGLELGGEPRR